jgi:hypothetical protein
MKYKVLPEEKKVLVWLPHLQVSIVRVGDVNFTDKHE